AAHLVGERAAMIVIEVDEVHFLFLEVIDDRPIVQITCDPSLFGKMCVRVENDAECDQQFGQWKRTKPLEGGLTVRAAFVGCVEEITRSPRIDQHRTCSRSDDVQQLGHGGMVHRACENCGVLKDRAASRMVQKSSNGGGIASSLYEKALASN